MKMEKVWGFVLAVAMCAAFAGCGQKAQEEAEQEYLTIGAQAEDAYYLLAANSTGQDITAFVMKTGAQEEYPANMMGTDAVWKNGETAEIYYLPEEAAETAEARESDVAFNPSYQAQVTLADGSVYELSALGLEDIGGDLALCLEEDTMYITYTIQTSGDTVSTKEQELAAKAQKEAAAKAENQPVPEEEPVQTEPAQTEPVQTAPAQTAPVQSAPAAEQIPAQTTEGCLTEGGGPVFN